MVRVIIHLRRNGWETALDNPKAVVVDYQDRVLRQGTSRFRVEGALMFEMLAFLIRNRGVCVTLADIGVSTSLSRNTVQQRLRSLGPALRWLGMTIETNYGIGYRLHSDPKDTLPCATLARSPVLPTHVQSLRKGRVVRPKEPLVSRDELEERGQKRQRPRKRSQPAPLQIAKPSNSPET